MPLPTPPGRNYTGKQVPHLSSRTRRLDLIAVTPAMAEAEIHDRALLAEELNAKVPRNWPPELRLDSLTWTWDLLRYDPGLCGWLDWFVILRSPPNSGPVLIGSVGFQGRPSPEGVLTMDYALTPQFEGRGYAVEAAAGLIAWAFAHNQVERIRADTHPVLTGSISLLNKLGFRRSANSPGGLALGYELKREDYLPELFMKNMMVK